MYKMNLLEIVQKVLKSMDDDNVSGISDTQSAEDVASIAKDVYYDLLTKADWPHIKLVTQLTGLGDSNKPNFMRLPSDIAEITDIRYDITTPADTKKVMQSITYYEDPADFLDAVLTRNTGNSNVVIKYTTTNVPIFVLNDIGPKFCTSFDDNEIVFDAYNAAVDSTLQTTKSIVEGIKIPVWSATNSFIPDMPGRLFPMYLEKVKILANEYLRQVDLKTDKEDYKTNFNRLRRKKVVNTNVRRKNYGRVSRGKI